MPPLASLHAGTDAGPEDSATLILQVQALGNGRPYRLSGPGLKGAGLLHVRGLPENFTQQWAANHGLFPRGIDLVLCAGTQLCALPRSTTVEEA